MRPKITRLSEFHPASRFVDMMHLSPEAIGLYWMICLQQLNERNPIDKGGLTYLIKCNKQNRARIFEELLSWRLIEYDGNFVSVPWCAEEIEKLLARPPQDFWSELRKEVFERDQYTCTYCGAKGGVLECDHIVPASRGGHAILENLTTACKPCNRAKGNLTPEEWN